jgi:hypothetical protein
MLDSLTSSAGIAMPIRLLLKNDHSFSPEDIAVIVAAFEQTLQELNLVNRDDPATLLIAKVIFEAAKQGERDPEQLRAHAVKQLSK